VRRWQHDLCARIVADYNGLVEVPEEKKVLAQISLKRELLKMSFAGIARDLNTKGIPTKKGGLWQPATVRSVLRTLRRRSEALRGTFVAG
jgi:hypothetical protein